MPTDVFSVLGLWLAATQDSPSPSVLASLEVGGPAPKLASYTAHRPNPAHCLPFVNSFIETWPCSFTSGLPWLLSPTLAKLHICGRDQQAHKAEYIPHLAHDGKSPLTHGLGFWVLAGPLGLAFFASPASRWILCMSRSLGYNSDQALKVDWWCSRLTGCLLPWLDLKLLELLDLNVGCEGLVADSILPLPFSPIPQALPVRPCGPWEIRSPPPSWPRRCRFQRCPGAEAVRDPKLHTRGLLGRVRLMGAERWQSVLFNSLI